MGEFSSTTLQNGRTLSYATFGVGSGPTLVFHHGTPGSRVLGRLLDEPARRRGARVVAPDRPGYGRSDPPGGDLETWAEDCLALAEDLGLETFAVAGFSGGGPFVLRVAQRYPDRVRGAGVVASPVPESDGGPFETLARAPRILDAAFRASGWVARRRGPMAVVG